MADLFLHQGRHITFDGHIHMTTMAQFSESLLDGEFPVTWSNNFANFGLPLPLFAHQFPAYLGALLIILGLSVVQAYNLLMFMGVLLGANFFYIFCRKYTSPQLALGATILMSFFPYRIINIYIRGGLPEVLAAAIFPILLLAIYQINENQKLLGFLWLSLGTALLALTHPMMLILFFLPLAIYYLTTLTNFKVRKQIITIVSVVLGAGLSAYYTLPLLLEMKYFYQGLGKSMINEESFLSFENFINPKWYYFLTHPGPRGNFIKLGLIEIFLITAVLASIIYLLIVKKKSLRKLVLRNKQLIGWTLISILGILLMLPFSKFIYNLVPGLNQVQYPWRFLAILQFSIPLSFIFLLKKLKTKLGELIMIVLLLIIIITRVPQLYGKNYISYPEEKFYFTKSNLHTANLNTIWSGNSEDYPLKEAQTEIITGEGLIQSKTLKNASREYKIIAQSPIRVIDYTFYFPGWTVKANGSPVEIEFQDVEYRGLITYQLPAGEYQVSVKYYPTKIRLAAQIITIGSGVVLIVFMLVLYKKKLL
ncbi:MAG: hypothetical protein XD98_0111 [Microgenomates bacterium 39_6]|nr:MAG: hypothetical protein XD98_0111 [Microgenomates bacterium 39_6]